MYDAVRGRPVAVSGLSSAIRPIDRRRSRPLRRVAAVLPRGEAALDERLRLAVDVLALRLLDRGLEAVAGVEARADSVALPTRRRRAVRDPPPERREPRGRLLLGTAGGPKSGLGVVEQVRVHR